MTGTLQPSLGENYFLNGQSIFCWEALNPFIPGSTQLRHYSAEAGTLVHDNSFFHHRLRTHLTRLSGKHVLCFKAWLICLSWEISGCNIFWAVSNRSCSIDSCLWKKLKSIWSSQDLKTDPRTFQRLGNDCLFICRAWIMVFQWDIGNIWRYRTLVVGKEYRILIAKDSKNKTWPLQMEKIDCRFLDMLGWVFTFRKL